MYFMYIHAIKKSLAGVWVDADKNEHIIKHNKWKDLLLIDDYKGIVKGPLIVLYTDKKILFGVLIRDHINWNDGSVWHCSYGEL